MKGFSPGFIFLVSSPFVLLARVWGNMFVFNNREHSKMVSSTYSLDRLQSVAQGPVTMLLCTYDEGDVPFKSVGFSFEYACSGECCWINRNVITVNVGIIFVFTPPELRKEREEIIHNNFSCESPIGVTGIYTACLFCCRTLTFFFLVGCVQEKLSGQGTFYFWLCN